METLSDRREELAPIFERHGITLREDVLDRPRYDLWESVGLGGLDKAVLPTTVVTRDLKEALDELDGLLGT